MTFKSLPSLGLFSGSSGSSMIASELNQYLERTGGGRYFAQNQSSDVLSHMNVFMNNVIYPQIQATYEFGNLVGISMLTDFKYIDSVEELEKGIPPSMYIPLLSYAPIRNMFTAGKISGFGLLPDELPDEDVWGRLIDNGRVDLSEPCPETGRVMNYHWKLDDPEWTFEDLCVVRRSRDWLMDFMEKTHYDFSDYPSKIKR